MFGFVTADLKELSREEIQRYNRVYCGICRRIRTSASQAARLGLSYDMAFLSLLLMSLYEPEETGGSRACALHPLRPHPWVDTIYIEYTADMNVALAYYKALDDREDEETISSGMRMRIFGKEMEKIRAKYPRQCRAIEEHLGKLRTLENENCPDPDKVAACFGSLLGELMVYRQDLWEDRLRGLGDALGRFIYLADAAVDYRRDLRKKQYNPFIAKGTGEDWESWEQYLVLSMGRCTAYFEQLPLVQDKKILDNILYSGVWLQYRQKQRHPAKAREDKHDRSL